MRIIVLLAILFFAQPALAQKRASFIDGTYAEDAAKCQRLADIKAGKAAANAYSTPTSLTSRGTLSGNDRCTFKSVETITRNRRWRIVMSCIDDGVPLESKAVITRKSKDALSVYSNETTVFYPSVMGVGTPAPGRPGFNAVTSKGAQTEVWQRCRL